MNSESEMGQLGNNSGLAESYDELSERRLARTLNDLADGIERTRAVRHQSYPTETRAAVTIGRV